MLEAAVAAGAQAIDIEIETAEAAAGAAEPVPWARQHGRLLPQLRIHPSHGYGGEPDHAGSGRRLQGGHHGAQAVRQSARPGGRQGASRGIAWWCSPWANWVFPRACFRPCSAAFTRTPRPMYAEGTAAGQVSARHLRRLFRVEKLRKATQDLRRDRRSYPALHFAGRAQPRVSIAPHGRGVPAVPGDARPTARFLFTTAERLPLAGFSVTIPHKQKVIRYLDAVDPLARRIGAVNTVWRKAGKWRGANTDVAGVTGPLAACSASGTPRS